MPVMARIVATSSKDIEELKSADFNPKLLLAMTAHVCRVPTLAERMEDFEALIAAYLTGDLNKPDMVPPRETILILKAHCWEGNVQELFNVIQHMVCMAGDQAPDKRFLPYYIDRTVQTGAPPNGEADFDLDDHFRWLAGEIRRRGFLAECRTILSVYQSAKGEEQGPGQNHGS